MISVCIPTYNGALYIEEQLRSILEQLGPNDEIIISDDHSTDYTRQKIQDLKDPRIRTFTNAKKAGPVHNIENALEQAKGGLIFLADQDDIWVHDKVSTMLPFLDRFDLVISDAVVVDKSGCELFDSFYKVNHSGRGFLRNWVNNSFLGCCMAFNRNLLDYVLPFPENIAMHDIWIGMNAALVAKYHFLPRKLIKYRRHGGNASPTAEKIKWRITYQVQYRLIMMYYVILRRIQRRFRDQH
jgi:glycosyltransferase involved in cell wall biosynthesis